MLYNSCPYVFSKAKKVVCEQLLSPKFVVYFPPTSEKEIKTKKERKKDKSKK